MEQLKEIPFSFQKHYESKCNCCEIIKKEAIEYSLEIRFIRTFDNKEKERRSFLLFYQPHWYSSFSENPRIIGQNTGTGKENISDLVEEMKKLLTP